MNMSRRFLIVVVLVAASAALPAAALASPQWLSPFDLSAAGGAALEQQAAFDGHDEALAIWRRREGTTGDFIVQVAIRPPGGPVTVQDVSAKGEGAYEPDIAVNDNGDAVATWSRSDGSHTRVEASIRPAGGSFGPVQILSPAGQNVHQPKAGIDARGEATVVWEVNNLSPLSGSTIQAAIRPPGQAFGPAKNLSVVSNALYCNWHDVDVNAHGDAVAVWARGPFPSPGVIQASFHGPGEGFGAPQTITDPAVVSGLNPHVAVDESGAALLEWAQEPLNSNHDVLQVATRPPGGVFGAATPISRAGEDANFASLAANRHGDAVVLWESYVSGLLQIEAARRPAGGAFGAVQDVTGTNGVPQSPSVAIDDAGDALAVWKHKPDTKQVIAGASAEAGGPFGDAVTLSDNDLDTANPSVAVSPRGDGLAVWEDYGAQADDVVAGAGFDRAGPTLSGLAVADSATAGQPASFAVTARDVWSPVSQLTWNFGDGSFADGGSLQHTFTAPGSFSATVTATDAAGNVTTSAPSSVAVGAAQGPAPALTLSGVSLKRHRFLVASRKAHVTSRARSRGTIFRYSLSEPATLSITLQRRLPGRREGVSCVAPTRRLARAKRCVRFVRAGRLVHASQAGRNVLPFSGRIGRRALRPGTYRAVMQAATSAGRHSRSVRVSFAILRG
jgi:hypothetical protein